MFAPGIAAPKSYAQHAADKVFAEQGNKYAPLTVCKGYKLIFIWNTGSPSTKYGLYQLSSSSCPSDFSKAHLLVTPASSPSKSASYNYTVPSTGNVSGIFVKRLPAYCLAAWQTLLLLLLSTCNTVVAGVTGKLDPVAACPRGMSLIAGHGH